MLVPSRLVRTQVPSAAPSHEMAATYLPGGQDEFENIMDIFPGGKMVAGFLSWAVCPHPTYVPKECAEGYSFQASMCYPDPPCEKFGEDWDFLLGVCWQPCSAVGAHYTDTGAFCQLDCPPKALNSCPADKPTQSGLLCYDEDPCPAGWTLNTGVCWAPCADGYTDMGFTCQ